MPSLCFSLAKHPGLGSDHHVVGAEDGLGTAHAPAVQSGLGQTRSPDRLFVRLGLRRPAPGQESCRRLPLNPLLRSASR